MARLDCKELTKFLDCQFTLSYIRSKLEPISLPVEVGKRVAAQTLPSKKFFSTKMSVASVVIILLLVAGVVSVYKFTSSPESSKPSIPKLSRVNHRHTNQKDPRNLKKGNSIVSQALRKQCTKSKSPWVDRHYFELFTESLLIMNEHYMIDCFYMITFIFAYTSLHFQLWTELSFLCLIYIDRVMSTLVYFLYLLLREIQQSNE